MELTFVLPVLLVLLTGIVQMGLMPFVHHNMVSVPQEMARLAAAGELTTDQGKTYPEGQIANGGMTYTIGVQQTAEDIVGDISVPHSDVALIDYLGPFKTGNRTTRSSMRAL